MTLIYNTVNKFINKLKKLSIVFIGLLLWFILIYPYAISFYIEKKYNDLIKHIAKLNPEIIITNNIQRKYLNSKLITKIKLPNDNVIILQHDIQHVAFNKDFYTNQPNIKIRTKIISGLPEFLQQEQALFALTTIDLKGKIKTFINPINIDYALKKDEDGKLLQIKKIAMQLEKNDKDFKLNLEIPKLFYTENDNKAEIEDVQVNVRVDNFKSTVDRNIKVSTGIDRIYLVQNLKPIFRLVNVNMEHNLSNFNFDNKSTLASNFSFLRLNIFEQKFGPLATKWQINNIHLPTIINEFKLPITIDKMVAYRFMETGSRLLSFQPKVSLDVLLNTASGKLKVSTDFAVNAKEADLFSKNDILDSLQANVVANIPKKMFFDLVSFWLEQKLKKDNTIHKNVVLKKPKEMQKQLESMVIERVSYLLTHRVISDREDGFALDLSIAEGTFFSRTNPFKVFSF